MTLAALILAAVAADSAAFGPVVLDSASTPASADSAFVPVLADSAARVDSAFVAAAAPVPGYSPHAAIAGLASFRLDWSNPTRISFRDPNDPMEPAAHATIASILRLRSGVRTRELSQGPSPESFAFDGAGSSSSELLLDGSSLVAPGTSGPHSEEIVLSEISDIAVLRGGAGALYGPQAASGAIVVAPRFPYTDQLLARAVGEEGSDEYQRASFQAARRLGSGMGFFASTESRRIEGFFPGTKEVDRQLVARFAGALPFRLEGEAGFRHYDGDERSGGVDDLPVIPVSTHTTQVSGRVFRAFNETQGVLLEARHVSEQIRNEDPAAYRTRELSGPELRATVDLPSVGPFAWCARAEASRWWVEDEEAGTDDRFWRTATALRANQHFASGVHFAQTIRVDREDDRSDAVHARVEGGLVRGRLSLSASVAQSERIPARTAALPDENETHRAAAVRAAWTQGPATYSVDVDATRALDLRPEPTFEELRRRDAADAAPIGTGELRGVTLGVVTRPFPVPGAAAIGTLTFDTSVAMRDDALEETGAPLARRPRLTWTGEGMLAHSFFRRSLAARLRGRITHLKDRVDDLGAPVVDAWVTDVIGEAEIGDALLHLRFHDLLERADEIEPGYRLPGFSWMVGVSWRFWG